MGALVALLLASGAADAPAALAETPAHTDVMLLFDTSGSMSSELGEAKAEIKEVIAHVSATLPDVQYGVAEVRDFPESEYAPEGATETYAWKLDQSVTSSLEAIQNAINPLTAGFGGDGPESYGRALWETDTNPTVGWRPGARHIIVLVADNVPHDSNLDEGIPETQWTGEGTPAPWNTGEELPGTFGIPGTVWTPGTVTEFHADLERLAVDAKPLGMVDFHGTEYGYLPYWEHWASLTGGEAVLGGTGELASKVTTLIETRATAPLPACPAGEIRNAAEACVHVSTTQVICNLIVATATDTCTATVGDAAAKSPTNPTSTVSFASANGGTFVAGNTCVLVATPLSGNTSSCSVQFAPPSLPASLPAITATYAGDALRAGSAGATSYPAAVELAKAASLSELGTIHNGTVEIPFECGFPCVMASELFTGPSLASLASTGTASVRLVLAEAASHKHKKKSHRPKLLGKGSAKLASPGKGRLIIRISRKYRHAIAHVKGNLHLTLKITTGTVNGTLVGNKSMHVTIKPKRVKKKRKH
jgi:hypothetical protein